MEIKPFTVFDHSIVAGWWQARNWPIVPIELLPTIGVIIHPYCAGFLYTSDNSAICFLEYVVSNPDTDRDERSKALNLLIERLLEVARASGAKVVFSSVKHEGLLNRYLAHGFVKGDEGMTNVIRSL